MAKLNANTTVMRPDTLEVVTLAEGDEVPDWAEGLIGNHLTGEPAVGAPGQSEDADGADKADGPDESWTVVGLREHAKANDIDLAGATTKADILAAINT